jgi:hypothetical protein
MSKILYYIYIAISVLALISTVLCALWWRRESISLYNLYTPVEPILCTLVSFAVMSYYLNKLHLFLD